MVEWGGGGGGGGGGWSLPSADITDKRPMNRVKQFFFFILIISYCLLFLQILYFFNWLIMKRVL